MWNSLADALDADSIANDWAAFSTADGTVHADWVVTLPGQYVMTNPVCDTLRELHSSDITAVAICNGAAAQTTAGMAAGLDVLKQHTLLPVVTIVISCH